MDLEDRRRLNPEGFARQERARDLETEIATLAAHIHAASYRLIELLAEFEAVHGWEGWPSPAHWLQWRCGFSLNAAREKFRVAHALPALPGIRAAFQQGALSFAQVRAMTRVATPENEATVLMWARHSTASQLERFARLYRRHGENAEAMAQHRERCFSHWEGDHGMVIFRIRLPAEQAAVVLKAVAAAKDSLDGRDREELMRARRDGDAAHPDEDVSAETRRARRADAFVRVMESYLEADARPRATAEKYQVHVHLDLRRHADGPVADPDAPALAEETIRRLGCEANLVAVLHEGGYGLRVTDDGALVFTRPGGERIPDVPRPLELTGHPVDFLCEAHGRADVSAETWRCHWDGTAPDYGAMVEILGRRRRVTAGDGSLPRVGYRW